MNAPKHSRPFNMEHAKAGAPYACRDGSPATVFKWDAKGGPFVLIGFTEHGGSETPDNWTADGFRTVRGEHPGDLVMTPLGYIDGKPFFVGDEIEVFSLPDTWEKMAAEPRHKMRHEPEIRWPAPAKVYPVTGMNEEQICSAFFGGGPVQGSNAEVRAYYRIANAALRHAIDSKQVFIKEDVDKAVDALMALYKGATAKREARDMAIAEAVRNACCEAVDVGEPSTASISMQYIDLAAIIAKVPVSA